MCYIFIFSLERYLFMKAYELARVKYNDVLLLQGDIVDDIRLIARYYL